MRAVNTSVHGHWTLKDTYGLALGDVYTCDCDTGDTLQNALSRASHSSATIAAVLILFVAVGHSGRD